MNIWKVCIFKNLLILEIITSTKEQQLQLFWKEIVILYFKE